MAVRAELKKNINCVSIFTFGCANSGRSTRTCGDYQKDAFASRRFRRTLLVLQGQTYAKLFRLCRTIKKLRLGWSI